MAEFHFTNKAVEDLTNIWNYTVEEWMEEQADEYYRMLIASCQKVANNPILFGRKYDVIADGLYGFKVNKHILFYHIMENGDVEIIRILHERMDLRIRLGE